MVGQEALIIAIYEEPEEVLRRAEDALELFLEVHRRQMQMIRQAGFTDGTVDWMSIWMDGLGACYSEDFSALVGAEQFREFFRPVNERLMAAMDCSMLHIHSGAWRCVPEILALPRLGAMELSNDPNGPALDKLIELGSRVQASGRALQMSNWEHPLPTADIERLLESLKPEGLIVTLQARTWDEVSELYALAKAPRRRGRAASA
jgi:hypothetical protein